MRSKGLFNEANLYSRIIEKIFFSKYQAGDLVVEFERRDIEKFARQLKLRLPKNLGDLIYSFRFRVPLPKSILQVATKGRSWTIELAGRARYRFSLHKTVIIVPNTNLTTTKIPDSTPGVIAKYALSDEQSLLAKVRYNRLIDIFTGVTCYSLQSHLRTTARGLGQVETDELYVGIDKRGIHYVFPIQAKGGNDKLSIVQIGQDAAVCEERFTSLVCRPVGAQFLGADVIVLYEFEKTRDGFRVSSEKHYRLVPPDEVTTADLESYCRRLAD
ncbi:MAG: hypothetical protein WAM91_05060 [Candidatus Acidiferrales bacterium]